MSEEGSTTEAGPPEDLRSRFGGNGVSGVSRFPRGSERRAYRAAKSPDGLSDVATQGHPDTMEAVARLAGRIAHHLNNLLTVVEGNAAFLDENLEDGLEDRRSAVELQEIRSVCGRASKLTTQLLSISGSRWGEPRTFDLRTLVSDMDLGYFFGEQVAFCTDFATVVCPVSVDPARMEEVVFELVLNAREAVGTRGTVRIGIDYVPCMKIDGGPEKEWVQLEVSDSGPGMDEGTLRRAIHPFFSTRPISADRGLGLSVACGIVQQSGGTVKMSSAPGSGTTVRVRLPAAASVSDLDQRP